MVAKPALKTLPNQVVYAAHMTVACAIDEIDAMIESAKIEIGEMPESGTWMGVSTEGGESQGQDQGVSEVPPKRRR